MIYLAAQAGWTVLIAPIVTALALAIGAVGGVLGTRRKARSDKINYDIALHETEQKLIESLVRRVDDLTGQVMKCQNDKYEMQRNMQAEVEAAVERKLKERLSGINPATPTA